MFDYLDDILVASKSKEEHKQHLEVLFNRLEAHGLVVKLEKCQFGVSQIEFLGHIVDATGIKPLPKKVEAIKNFTVPNNVKSLGSFLGMVNF